MYLVQYDCDEGYIKTQSSLSSAESTIWSGICEKLCSLYLLIVAYVCELTAF